MNRYTHYAPGGITDCDPALLGTAIADDLSNQACLLSLAKNKSSLIRVGGGENWGKLMNHALDFFRIMAIPATSSHHLSLSDTTYPTIQYICVNMKTRRTEP